MIFKNDILYISGPVSTGKNENTEERFTDTENLFKDRCIVLNPFKVPYGLSQDAYMDISFAMIRASKICYFMRDWETSLGCKAEFAYAKKLNKDIRFEDYNHYQEYLND